MALPIELWTLVLRWVVQSELSAWLATARARESKPAPPHSPTAFWGVSRAWRDVSHVDVPIRRALTAYFALTRSPERLMARICTTDVSAWPKRLADPSDAARLKTTLRYHFTVMIPFGWAMRAFQQVIVVRSPSPMPMLDWRKLWRAVSAYATVEDLQSAFGLQRSPVTYDHAEDVAFYLSVTLWMLKTYEDRGIHEWYKPPGNWSRAQVHLTGLLATWAVGLKHFLHEQLGVAVSASESPHGWANACRLLGKRCPAGLKILAKLSREDSDCSMDRMLLLAKGDLSDIVWLTRADLIVPQSGFPSGLAFLTYTTQRQIADLVQDIIDRLLGPVWGNLPPARTVTFEFFFVLVHHAAFSDGDVTALAICYAHRLTFEAIDSIRTSLVRTQLNVLSRVDDLDSRGYPTSLQPYIRLFTGSMAKVLPSIRVRERIAIIMVNFARHVKQEERNMQAFFFGR